MNYKFWWATLIYDLNIIIRSIYVLVSISFKYKSTSIHGLATLLTIYFVMNSD